MNLANLRNIGISAHIDSGKTTLSERILFYAGRIHRMQEVRGEGATMDHMDLERERGITITSAATSVDWNGAVINLIDTPGHVDFSHEVRRSLMACEGALIVIDASQGVEAQTVANAYAAMEHNLEVIPVLNKIDVTHARPDEVAEELEQSLGFDAVETIRCSAKTGEGVEELLAQAAQAGDFPIHSLREPGYRGRIVLRSAHKHFQ